LKYEISNPVVSWQLVAQTAVFAVCGFIADGTVALDG
jgi:hypothetical protein